MKKLGMVVLIAILLTASQGLAARGGGGGGMGGGSGSGGTGGSGGMGSGGTGDMGSGGMGSSAAQGSAGQGKMMQGSSMNEAMAPMMQRMNDMTNRMSSIVKGGMNQGTRTKMSQFMRDMSKEMGEMSGMMERGQVSEVDMQKMKGRLADMQKRLEGIQGK